MSHYPNTNFTSGKKKNDATKETQLSDYDSSALMGVTLIVGFVLMLLIDQLSSKHSRGIFFIIFRKALFR